MHVRRDTYSYLKHASKLLLKIRICLEEVKVPALRMCKMRRWDFSMAKRKRKPVKHKFLTIWALMHVITSFGTPKTQIWIDNSLSQSKAWKVHAFKKSVGNGSMPGLAAFTIAEKSS